MRTIAFVTQKGGAGKSTLASNIAVAGRQAGERVFIFDLDPLQSLVKWSKARGSSDVPIEHIPPGNLAKALTELQNEGVTLAIIDAPGADSNCSDQAIRAADLCVIPARPNAFDLWASEVTLERVKANKKDYAFLLNQCPPAQQSARVKQGATALQEMWALLAPLISARVDYQEAVRLGLGVSELNPNGVAAQEMRELWESLRRRLKKEGVARPRATKIDAATKLQSDFAKSAYEDFVAEAIKAGNMYSNFVKGLFEYSEVKAPLKSAAAAAPPKTAVTSKEK
jgi:chromosome partitioning protein